MCQWIKVGALTWRRWEPSECCDPYVSSLEFPVRTCALIHTYCRKHLFLVYTIWYHLEGLLRRFGFTVHIQACRWWWTPSSKPCCHCCTSPCWSFYWSLFMPSWDWNSSSAKCIRPAIILEHVRVNAIRHCYAYLCCHLCHTWYIINHNY